MRRLLFVFTLAGLTLSAGCSDSVDPTLGTDQAFSLYGYLDPTADRQAIRVVPILTTLDADTSRVLAAEVTSTELGSGRTVTWQDSLVTFPLGSTRSTGHVFVADYTPTPGETVEIQVRETAGEGRVTTVRVEVPALTRSSIGQPSFSDGQATYPVFTPGAARVIGGTLRLYVSGLPSSPSDTTTLVVPVAPEDLDLSHEGDVWSASVPFLTATRAFLQEEGLFQTGLTLIEAEFAPFVTSDGWAVPPGGLDLDAIVEPGTFSNVNGGFGFVGAGFEAPVRWLPSPSTQFRAGFSIVGDPAGLVVVNEVSQGYVELYNPSLEPADLGGYVVSAGAPQEGVRIPSSTQIAGGGFHVVDGPFAIEAAGTITFTSPSGRVIHSLYMDQDLGLELEGPSWGSYPDGMSFPIRGAVRGDDGRNLFHGPLRSTRGRPNRPQNVPAVFNEISSSGDGFVEVLQTSPILISADVSASSRDLFSGADASPVGESLLVADEGPELTLDQAGETLYLLARFGSSENLIIRVVDVRTYGPQSPGLSSGYFPDGRRNPIDLDEGWRSDLIPTRGAPNATTSRLASR